MAYKRKTKDIWVIQVNYGYGHGWEDEVVEETYRDAVAQRTAYRENCPQYPCRIKLKREPVEASKQ